MAQRLQITFVAPFGLRKKTTVWARIMPLAQRLHAFGHRVRLLVPPWDSPQDADQTEIRDGVTVEYVTLSGGPVATTARLVLRLRKLDPNIIHIVKPRAYAGLTQWCIWYGRRFLAPHALLCLDLDDWEQAWAPITNYPWPLEPVLAWQEEWGIRHADAITTASRWLKEKVDEVSPSIPNLYLPNGITQSPAASGRPDCNQMVPSNFSVFRVLYFTRFVEVPPGWLVNFWRRVQTRLPRAQLIIAGQALQQGRETDYQAAMRAGGIPVTAGSAVELAKQTTTGPIWLGYVVPQQLEQMYATIDCAIFPAQPTVLQQAKCSIRLATTILAGVPCIASRVGEHQFYGANGAARLVDADATADEFANVVVDILTDPNQRQALSRRGQQHLLDHYNWYKLSRKLESFYLSALDAEQ